MEITDEDRLQPYMVKEVYVDAVLAGNFFPNIWNLAVMKLDERS